MSLSLALHLTTARSLVATMPECSSSCWCPCPGLHALDYWKCSHNFLFKLFYPSRWLSPSVRTAFSHFSSFQCSQCYLMVVDLQKILVNGSILFCAHSVSCQKHRSLHCTEPLKAYLAQLEVAAQHSQNFALL